MFDVFNKNVLVVESVIHLLLDVAAVLLELGPRAPLEVLDPLVLAIDLRRDALVKLCLLCQTLFFFYLQGLFNLS